MTTAMKSALVAAAAFLSLALPAGAVAPAIDQSTVIHPGDQIAIQVYGNQMLSQTVTVLDDGTIDYPLIGRVHVANHTPAQAAGLLKTKLLTYIRQPVVSVSITQLGQPRVLVLGDVKNPGEYQLRSDPQVTDAIAAAGGLVNVNGAFPQARVADADGHVTTVSLQALLHNGDMSQNLHLGEGSVVYVPGPMQFNVEVIGAVDHPGQIQVNEGDRISAAIALAGDDANAHADLNHIRLIRYVDGKEVTKEINLYRAINNGDSAVDMQLEKGDVVYVPQSRQPSTDLVPSGVSGFLYILSRLIP
jgi:polysaccharide export outer membrane protein